jgi:transcriptional regulator with XRE-family HTH domain
MRGERIRKLREELGWTQDVLAEKIGVPVLQINRYENNKTKPNADMITILAENLSCSADYLLGLTDDPTPHHLEASELRAKERIAIAAWRRGDRFEAIKVIVGDE